MTESKERAAKWVRHYRLEAGLTQEQLAREAGINMQIVSTTERGISTATVDNLEAMARVLGVGIEDLLSEKEPRRRTSRRAGNGYSLLTALEQRRLPPEIVRSDWNRPLRVSDPIPERAAL